MRQFGWFITCMGLMLQIIVSPLEAQSKYYRFTILHTNDTHGHLLPFSYPERLDPNLQESKLPVKRDIGGVARRATLVKQIKGESKDDVLLVDCGDYMDGTPFSLEYKGEADIAAMNACGYDFATLGNHEFSNLLPQVKKLIDAAKFPILLANAREIESGDYLGMRAVVIERSGIRFGLFGLVTADARTYPGADKVLEIRDPIETAREIVPQLRREADVVILLSHLGIEVEERLAKTVPGIDVIIGGHSHTRLEEPRFVEWETKDFPNMGGTVITQAHQWGGELGQLDLLFVRDQETNQWRLSAYKTSLLPVTNQIQEAPEVKKVVNKFWMPIARRYGVKVGEAKEDFVQIGDDLAEYYLVSDAVRSEFNVDFDLQNLYGIRTPLAKGAITVYDLSRMMPFGNTVMKFQIKGSDLKQILRQHKPAVGGIRYRVEGGELKDATINGKPIEDETLYTGTTNSYFARRALSPLNLQYTDTKEDILQVVARYLKKVKAVSPSYDGRRIVKG